LVAASIARYGRLALELVFGSHAVDGLFGDAELGSYVVVAETLSPAPFDLYWSHWPLPFFAWDLARSCRDTSVARQS